MSNKIQTIYEILGTDDEKLIMDILNELSDDERNLFNKRFGKDLNNPVLDSSWSSRDSMDFHTKLVPHMKEILKEKQVILTDSPSTIFELLKTNRKDLVEEIINELLDDEKDLFKRKNGDDLENPVISKDWSYKDSINFYSHLLPKMKDMLKDKEKQEIPILETEKLEELLKQDVVEETLNVDTKIEIPKKKKRGKKLKTIYELLNTNDKAFVNELIETLTVDEKKLFDRRNGKDLDNPISSEDWTSDDNIKFTSVIVRKLRYRMKNRLEIKEKAYQLISIYEILKTSNEKLVSDIINSLTDKERGLFKRRNGEDMQHPVISDDWTLEDEYVYFHDLIPKMQRKLSGKINGSKVGEKLVPIYALLGTSDKDLIMKIVSSKLTKDEQKLFKRRNGDDLDNPISSEDWTSDDTNNFNQSLLPKIRRILDSEYNIKTVKQKNFKTMFELLNIEDEELMLELKEELADEEKQLFDRRNGTDLRNPKHSDNWTKEDTVNFNAKVVKKMRRLLIRKQNGKVSRYLSIYKLLNTDDVALVQKVIDRLTTEEQKLFWKRNGTDLNNPMPSEDYNNLDQDRFNVNLISKMRTLMNEEKNKQVDDTLPEILDMNDVESKVDNSVKSLEIVTEEIIEKHEEKEKTQEIIRVEFNENNCLPYLDKVLGKLSIKEAVITSLKLVLNFNTNEISTFLNIEKDEITNIVKNALNTYKIYFTSYIDNLIEEKTIPILVEEKDYLKAIKNLSFGDLLDRLSLKEAIMVCLSLGLVDEKIYSVDEISNFLKISKEDCLKMNKKALLIYKQIINDNIDKVIDEMSEHEGPKK